MLLPLLLVLLLLLLYLLLFACATQGFPSKLRVAEQSELDSDKAEARRAEEARASLINLGVAWALVRTLLVFLYKGFTASDVFKRSGIDTQPVTLCTCTKCICAGDGRVGGQGI